MSEQRSHTESGSFVTGAVGACWVRGEDGVLRECTPSQYTAEINRLRSALFKLTAIGPNYTIAEAEKIARDALSDDQEVAK